MAHDGRRADWHRKWHQRTAGDGEPLPAENGEEQVPKLVRAERDAAKDVEPFAVAERYDGLPGEQEQHGGAPVPVASGAPGARVVAPGGKLRDLVGFHGRQRCRFEGSFAILNRQAGRCESRVARGALRVRCRIYGILMTSKRFARAFSAVHGGCLGVIRRVMALGLVTAMACGGNDGPKPLVVKDLTLPPASASLTVGSPPLVTATAVGTDGTVIADAPVSWSTATPGVINVSSSGVVIGLQQGQGTVRAVSG